MVAKEGTQLPDRRRLESVQSRNAGGGERRIQSSVPTDDHQLVRTSMELFSLLGYLLEQQRRHLPRVAVRRQLDDSPLVLDEDRDGVQASPRWVDVAVGHQRHPEGARIRVGQFVRNASSRLRSAASS